MAVSATGGKKISLGDGSKVIRHSLKKSHVVGKNTEVARAMFISKAL